MTIPVWPAALPQNMTAPDYNSALVDHRIRTPMEVGPPKFRVRMSSAPRPVSGIIRCTRDQLAQLECFWLDDLRKGTLPFVFPGQIFHNAGLLTEEYQQILTEDDEPLLLDDFWLVQFAAAPDFRPHRRSVVQAVSIQLSVLP